MVSIVIPTFNSSKTIIATLKSVKNQTYTNWECIIIDDLSSDDTISIVESFISQDIRFKLFKRPTHLTNGASSCRNYGFLQCNGNFVNFLDSDDFYYNNTLSTFISHIEDSTDAVIAKLQFYNLNKDIKIKINSIISNNIIEDYYVGKISFYVSGPMWKYEFLKKQKYLFDEKISNLDDWDFNLRMIYQNPTFKYIEEPLIQYNIQPNSLSHEIIKFNINEVISEISAREKHYLLLKDKLNIKKNKIVNFQIVRYKFFFLKACLTNHPKKIYFFKILILKQLLNNDLIGFCKTIFAYISFSIFNKGSIFLK